MRSIETRRWHVSVRNVSYLHQGLLTHLPIQLFKLLFLQIKNCTECTTIERRFSDFVSLRKQLHLIRGVIIPPLPEKTILGVLCLLFNAISCKFSAGRFNSQLLKKRQRGLQDFLERVSHHKYLQNAESLRIFLTASNRKACSV